MVTPVSPLDPPTRDALDRDGYLLLRGVFADRVEAIRKAFDDGALASDQWPVPRGPDWSHALVDLDPYVQALCRLPVMLSAAHRLIGTNFFLAQVEGREPRPSRGLQGLHRDGFGPGEPPMVSALAFIDDYGPGNGATRVVPGSHRLAADLDARAMEGPVMEDRAVTLEGKGGDVLLFDADLLHGATMNRTGERRRSLLISYFAEALEPKHLASAASRNVRMALERFGE